MIDKASVRFKLLSNLKNVWWYYLTGVIGMAVYPVAISTLFSYFLRVVSSEFVTTKTSSNIISFILASVIILILYCACYIFYMYGFTKASYIIRDKAYMSLVDMRIDEVEKHGSSNLLNRLAGDLSTSCTGFGWSFTQVVSAILSITLGIVSICMFNVLLSLIPAFCGFLCLLWAYVAKRITKSATEKEKKASDRMASFFVSAISCLDSIRIFNLTHVFSKQFSIESESARRHCETQTNISTLTDAVGSVLDLASYIVLVTMGLLWINRSLATIPDLVFALGQSSFIVGAFKNLSSSLLWFESTLVSAGRIYEIIDSKSDSLLSKKTQKTPSFSERGLYIEHLRFKYEGAKEYLLSDVSVKVRCGETVAISGKSGTGKSTLVKLVLGLIDSKDLPIFLNGIPMSSWMPCEWRRRVVWVPQESYFFTGTVRDNITFGEAYKEADIKAALEKSCANSFVYDLPLGLDTLLKEDGKNLSGGQKQMLSIARVILKKADVIILDEPTSGLDLLSESIVLDGIKSLAKTSAVLIVTHRQSVLRYVDVNYELVDGILVKQ